MLMALVFQGLDENYLCNSGFTLAKNNKVLLLFGCGF